MKKFIGSVLTCVTIIATSTISFGLSGTINTDTARLRSKASADSTVVDLLSINDKVEILEESGDWYKVKAGKLTGYVSKSLLDVDGSTENKEKETTEENTKKEEKTENKTEETKTETEEQKNEESDTKKTENEFKLSEKYKGTLASEVTVKIIPSINSMNISKIEKNTEFEVVEILNDWCHLETKSVSGWARKSLVEKSIATEAEKAEEEKPAEEEKKEETKIGYVSVESVNVRKDKSTSSEKIDSLTKNTQVTILAEEDGWYKVKINDVTGYISKKYISDKKVEEVTSRASDSARQIAGSNEEAQSAPAAPITGNKGTDVVSFAKQYLGYKYVSGGASPSTGFDCSGFTSYVYSNFGVSLSRASTGQAHNGTSISTSELQPGDLLIFNNRSNTSVGHVGIYMGNNQFIHSANPGTGVVTESLSSSYYDQRFVDARRVLD